MSGYDCRNLKKRFSSRRKVDSEFAVNFGTRADIADVITHAKFYVNIGSGVGGSGTPKFALLHGLSWSLLQQYKHSRATL